MRLSSISAYKNYDTDEFKFSVTFAGTDGSCLLRNLTDSQSKAVTDLIKSFEEEIVLDVIRGLQR